MFFPGGQEILIKKSSEEPDGCIIQANQAMDVKFTLGIIPWTHVMFLQNTSEEVFPYENVKHINSASDHYVTVFV